MSKLKMLASGMALAALVSTSITPAFAENRRDRARAAIAQAHAKIDAANKVGATGETPRLQAEAAAELRGAEEAFEQSNEVLAIERANRATQLADTAIGQTQQNRQVDASIQRADAAAAVSSAQQQAADAQAQAADAKARAAVAEQQAASAAAEAAAARAAPPTTTIVTETVKSTAATPVKRTTKAKRVVRKAAPRATARTAATERTTTTVTTQPN